MSIKKNIGKPDRVARIILGVMLIAIIPLAFIGPKTPLAYWGILGIMPLVAGLTGYCPPYELLGINTYAKKKTLEHD